MGLRVSELKTLNTQIHSGTKLYYWQALSLNRPQGPLANQLTRHQAQRTSKTEKERRGGRGEGEKE